MFATSLKNVYSPCVRLSETYLTKSLISLTKIQLQKMTHLSKISRLLTNTAATAFTLFALTHCTDKDEITSSNISTEKPQAAQTLAHDEPALSLTIDGTFTVLSSTTDCKTCAYIVPEDATEVDGAELGIKPGEAICLKAGILYGHLKIINVVGEEDKPVTIAYGVQTFGLETETFNFADIEFNKSSASL